MIQEVHTGTLLYNSVDTWAILYLLGQEETDYFGGLHSNITKCKRRLSNDLCACIRIQVILAAGFL